MCDDDGLEFFLPNLDDDDDDDDTGGVSSLGGVPLQRSSTQSIGRRL